MSNVWGALMIESVPGGGYIVREHQYRAELYSQHLFACSQKSELLTFIQKGIIYLTPSPVLGRFCP